MFKSIFENFIIALWPMWVGLSAAFVYWLIRDYLQLRKFNQDLIIMNKTIKVKAIVLGKWKSAIWRRPYLSVKLTDPRVLNPYQDYRVKMAFWYAVDKGSNITIELELNENGKWYPA